jgi:Putative adhesin
VILTLALVATLAAHQSNEPTFHWNGQVAAGHWLRVHNLSGAIHVEKSTSNQVEVDAEKVGRHGEADSDNEIHFEMRRTGPDSGDVLICALWGQESSCDVEGDHYHTQHHHHWDGDDNDVSVRFTIRLPAGVNIGVSTVNGDVSVNGATAEVHARTVNGTVAANTEGGPVNASTVNGDVDVRMASTGHAADLDYSTVNGSVTVTLPTKFDADVDLSTVNGNVQSDYPLTLEGHIDPKHLHGTIGNGGLHLHASTVNGQIELRKT